MISALFEILALLIVSCLIGVFFTYRFWKSKYKKIEERLAEAELKNQQIASELAMINKEKNELEKSKETLKEENSKLQKKLKSQDKDKISTKADLGEIDQLKQKVELQEESLQEKEREIESLSKELAAKKISYYKQIDGKRYKAVTLLKADEAVSGKGDGRISKADAEEIFATISDGKSYTQVEKDTMRYLRDNYNWTEGADELFRKKVRSWAAKGHELDK